MSAAVNKRLHHSPSTNRQGPMHESAISKICFVSVAPNVVSMVSKNGLQLCIHTHYNIHSSIVCSSTFDFAGTCPGYALTWQLSLIPPDISFSYLLGFKQSELEELIYHRFFFPFSSFLGSSNTFACESEMIVPFL